MADHAAESQNSGLVQLSDAQYDFFRQILEKVFPAFGAFYALVGGYLHWDNVIQVTGITAGAAVFLGVVLSLARKGYVPEKQVVPPADIPKDGQVVNGIVDGKPAIRVELTPDAQQNLLNKDYLLIKGFDPEA